MTRRTFFGGLFIVLIGCACTTATPSVPVAGVSDVYFTNAEGAPGYQLYQSGATPYQVRPKVSVFDRNRDSKVTMVVVFTSGSAHSLRAVLNQPGGGPARPVSWSVPSRTQVGTWTTSSAWWSVAPKMAPGSYTVDLTIDEKSAGT